MCCRSGGFYCVAIALVAFVRQCGDLRCRCVAMFRCVCCLRRVDMLVMLIHVVDLQSCFDMR